MKRVGVLINLRSTTQLNTIGPWLKRPKLYTLCEKREREREKRSIHINTKSAKNPRPKNNAKQTISHLHFPSLFFLAFSKATTTKSHTLKHTKETLNRKERRYLIFHHSCWACSSYLQKRYTQQMILCVSYIFWCLYP